MDLQQSGASDLGGGQGESCLVASTSTPDGHVAVKCVTLSNSKLLEEKESLCKNALAPEEAGWKLRTHQ